MLSFGISSMHISKGQGTNYETDVAEKDMTWKQIDVYWEISTLNRYKFLFIQVFSIVDVIRACRHHTKHQVEDRTEKSQFPWHLLNQLESTEWDIVH
jgi:hypothetical protein